jgi:two-component system copper resistance phosphate regulon response regulator CusR/two-component system response regulator QseB
MQCLDDLDYPYELIENVEQARQRAGQGPHDLVVIMDSKDFTAAELLRDFRKAGSNDPVLVILDNEDRENIVKAFDAGADQVVDCNASNREWAARVRSLLRQCDPTPGDTLTYEDVQIDLPPMRATRQGKVLNLKGKPYSLLEFFLRHPETVHSRERISKSVWDHNLDLFSNVIEVTISKLRAEVDKPFDTEYLHTVTGRGYIFSKTPPPK